MNCFQLVSLIHHKLSDSIPSVCRDWCSDLRGSTELFCPRLVSGHHVVLHISPYQEQKAGHHCGVFALASSMIEIPQSISCISSLISEVWWNNKTLQIDHLCYCFSLIFPGFKAWCRSCHNMPVLAPWISIASCGSIFLGSKRFSWKLLSGQSWEALWFRMTPKALCYVDAG